MFSVLLLKIRADRFEVCAQRVLPYDETAVRTYGDIIGFQKEIGHPMSIPDGQSVAIAKIDLEIHAIWSRLTDGDHCEHENWSIEATS